MSGHGPNDLRAADAGILELSESGLQRVERAGANVAEHDADRPYGQNPEVTAAMRRARVRPGNVLGGNDSGCIVRHQCLT